MFFDTSAARPLPLSTQNIITVLQLRPSQQSNDPSIEAPLLAGSLLSLHRPSMDEHLPELPPGWRDDVAHMLCDFLEEAGLARTLHALEVRRCELNPRLDPALKALVFP